AGQVGQPGVGPLAQISNDFETGDDLGFTIRHGVFAGDTQVEIAVGVSARPDIDLTSGVAIGAVTTLVILGVVGEAQVVKADITVNTRGQGVAHLVLQDGVGPQFGNVVVLDGFVQVLGLGRQRDVVGSSHFLVIDRTQGIAQAQSQAHVGPNVLQGQTKVQTEDRGIILEGGVIDGARGPGHVGVGPITIYSV